MPPERALSRELVLRAAVEYVDEEGLTALTMRNLGSRLGVEAMSLYHHVNGREDLLEGMVEMVTDDVMLPPREPANDNEGWQTFLQEVAHAVRAAATEHPRVFPLVATRSPAAPWLRPPLRNLRLVDDFLAGLSGRGLPDDRVVQVYKVFTGFLLGHLLLEVSQRGVPISPLDDPEATPAADGGPLDQYPHVRRLQPLLSEDESVAEFEESLENLLERLQRVLRESRRPGSIS